MWTLLVIIHILICLVLMMVILMQTGKGGLDSNFSGIASNTFGTQGASEVIKRTTQVMFGVFIISCVLLATMNPGQTKKSNISEKLKKEAAATQKPTQKLPVAPK
ncbi:MAG: preprotein translocase subunit SecG [Candidatus Cloacimonetes bacterium]|nr:preprotein translocase subunit SecG [Candidatus Cloacimonadota bacterium]